MLHHEEEAWLYPCEVAKGVFDECYKVRNIGSERSNVEGSAATAVREDASSCNQCTAVTPFSSVTLPEWSSENVVEWFRSIGEAELASKLTSHNITGQDLQTLTEEELQDDLNVEDAQQRMKILQEIGRIKLGMADKLEFSASTMVF